MNTYLLSLLAIGLSIGSWLSVRLSYSFLPSSWNDKPFWVSFWLYVLALIVSGTAVIQAFLYVGLPATTWWQSILAIALALTTGVLALVGFTLLYGEGMQGHSNRSLTTTSPKHHDVRTDIFANSALQDSL